MIWKIKLIIQILNQYYHSNYCKFRKLFEADTKDEYVKSFYQNMIIQP